MKFLIYIIVILFGSFLYGQSNEAFEEANARYNDGDYQEAIDIYTSILEEGQHSSELYYNIGNAHYKLNNVAPSIYYYEKALLLNPNDKDLLNNMAYAKNMTIDAIEVVPEVGFSKLIKTLTNTMSFDNWAKLAVSLVVFFVLLFLMYYFSQITGKKRLAFITSLLSLILAFITLGFAFNSYDLNQKNNPAIVFVKESQVKSEPNLRSAGAFEIHEGTKVQVIDTVSNWKKIRLSDGKSGWVSNEDIKMIKDF